MNRNSVLPAALLALAAAGCHVPSLAPGTLAENLERLPVDCQVLPTGTYDVNVLTGLAGARVFNYR
ncbi:MAG TPA: hypothetical protein PKE47_07640, partial [Verrucomicrobiota bacterium]|nr:hypothetical protein [Verrucomicrobiota bacterium]